MNASCSTCGKSADCRPYGNGGVLVCFACGMADVETTEREFGALLAECEGDDIILTTAGPVAAASPEQGTPK